MTIFKCKMCGGDLLINGFEKVVEYDYARVQSLLQNIID